MRDPNDRRRAPRVLVEASAELVACGMTGQVAVVDVSSSGARLELGGRIVAPRSMIYLRLRHYGLRKAEVIWMSGNRIGVRFVEPLGIALPGVRELTQSAMR